MEPIESTETIPALVEASLNATDPFTTIWQILNILLWLGILVLLVLVIRALYKHQRSKSHHQQETVTKSPLWEVLKEHRTQHGMTQEFVAESLGVSRQAVSKWENGTADPSTANLLKLAELYDISPEELLRSVSANEPKA